MSCIVLKIYWNSDQLNIYSLQFLRIISNLRRAAGYFFNMNIFSIFKFACENSCSSHCLKLTLPMFLNFFHVSALCFLYSFKLSCRGVELAVGMEIFLDFHKVEGW